MNLQQNLSPVEGEFEVVKSSILIAFPLPGKNDRIIENDDIGTSQRLTYALAEGRWTKTIWLSTICKDHASLRIFAQRSALVRRRRYDYVLMEKVWIWARNWSNLISRPQSLIPSQITVTFVFKFNYVASRKMEQVPSRTSPLPLRDSAVGSFWKDTPTAMRGHLRPCLQASQSYIWSDASWTVNVSEGNLLYAICL